MRNASLKRLAFLICSFTSVPAGGSETVFIPIHPIALTCLLCHFELNGFTARYVEEVYSCFVII
jgi:hypothetical protein